MLAVCVGIGASVVFHPAVPRIPLAVWLLLFATLFAALLITAAAERRAASRLGTYAAAVVLGWCVLLTAPEARILAIVLVVTAAVGADLLPFRINAAVVALNSAVIAIAWSISGELADIAFAVGFYTLIQLAAVLSVTAVLREQRMRRELTTAHVELQAAGVLLEDSARTAERLRISRDLHDLIGHRLTVLTLELEAARHREGEDAHRHIERADRAARDLLADVRSTVDALRAEPSEDLAESLRRISRDVPGLDVAVEVAGDVRVDEEQAAALVRAAKEIVTNTLRHAEARELWIDVARDGDTIRLTAADDGRGTPGFVPGNGLSGLAERFEALGGGVEYDGGKGFRVAARVPAR